MKKTGAAGIQRGQAITFRIPSDTPDHILVKLQSLKETEKRNFSSKIAGFVTEGVSQSLANERETITIPLPKQLSKEQRNWLKHTHSEALIGNIIHHLLADPLRATSVLATLNSGALDIDEALYLQERESETSEQAPPAVTPAPVPDFDDDQDEFEDDMMNFNWEQIKTEEEPVEKEDLAGEEEIDPLGDFLAQMNK